MKKVTWRVFILIEWLIVCACVQAKAQLTWPPWSARCVETGCWTNVSLTFTSRSTRNSSPFSARCAMPTLWRGSCWRHTWHHATPPISRCSARCVACTSSCEAHWLHTWSSVARRRHAWCAGRTSKLGPTWRSTITGGYRTFRQTASGVQVTKVTKVKNEAMGCRQ